MTVQQAEAIILRTDARIALRHRFGGDTGTILRLDNYAMINIFDDGRYYIQGENTEALTIAFGLIEQAWDPDTWQGSKPERTLPLLPPDSPTKRFEF